MHQPLVTTITQFFIFPLATLTMMVAGILAGCQPLVVPANDKTVSPTVGIEALETIELGGVQQWVLLRGEDQRKPVLLWLHGGPGIPTMPLAHVYDQELLNHFVVVHWDQRGAGKSYDPALTAEMLTTQHYISDTHELVQHLRARFAVPKIYLVGHSWGAELGALTVARYPELFHAFVGVGQAVSLPEGYKVGYDQLLTEARRSENADALRELEALGPPPWQGFEALGIFGKWNSIFGGIMRGVDPEQLNRMQQGSPFYTPEDFEKTNQGNALSVGAMLSQIMAIDLFVQAPRLETPVYIFQGRHDLAAPAAVAERYFNELDAPQGKQLIWFEESAHFPMYEEPAKFTAALLRVLAETSSGKTVSDLTQPPQPNQT